jgi:probable phosphoglycerate mutase
MKDESSVSSFIPRPSSFAMTILLLIRHASNDYLKANKLAGLTPGVHLNAQGQREADALARRVNHIALHAIYASPLERAIETAQAIAQCQHLEIKIRDELGETRLGEWTGKTIKELEGTDAWKQIQTAPAEFRFPGGESLRETQARMVGAIDAIIAAHANQVVAIVSHADPIKAALAHYLKMNLNDFQRLVISPASVSVLFFNEHGATLFRLNDSDKLPDFKPEPKKKENAKG